MKTELLSMGLILVTGYLSAALFLYWKIPAARLIGPIFAVAILKIYGINILAPSYFRIFLSLILGVFIGLKFNSKTVAQLKATAKPSLFLIGWYILVTILFGYLLTRMSILGRATAFLSVIPGGIAEVNILAVSYHADMAQITSFQIARLLTVILIVPLLVKKVLTPVEDEEEINLLKDKYAKESWKICQWWYIFIIGAIGGLIFSVLNFPAGSLVGALVAVGAYNLLASKEVTNPPISIYNMAQIGMGGIIGTSFSLDSLHSIETLVFPILIMTFLIIFNSLVLAWIFSKIFNWQYITSFLSIVPGGLAPMVIIADEVKADIILVSALQMVRLLTAILFIPLIYTLFI